MSPKKKLSESNQAAYHNAKENPKQQPSINHYIAVVLIFLSGIVLILVSNFIPQFNDQQKTDENIWHLVLRDTGVAFFPLAIVSFLYEILLRRDFLSNMSATIRQDFLSNMEITIKKLMPGNYSRMRDGGLIDIYENLLLDKLRENISLIKNSEVKILDIWIENFNRISDSLIKAIEENNCEVKIILWNPMHQDALKNRAKSLDDGSTPRTMTENIIRTLRYIEHIFEKIEDHDNRDKFKVKLYNGFIAVSFIGYGDECLIGHYLRKNFSSMGSQIKVAGKTHFFFQELENHFNDQWNAGEDECIDYKRSDLAKYQKWFDEHFHSNHAPLHKGSK